MRKILLSLSAMGLLAMPATPAAAGPVEDVEEAYGHIKCIVSHPQHWYFYCYGG